MKKNHTIEFLNSEGYERYEILAYISSNRFKEKICNSIVLFEYIHIFNSQKINESETTRNYFQQNFTVEAVHPVLWALQPAASYSSNCT